MLMNIIVASFLSDIIRSKDIFKRVCAILLIVMLTSTGIYDTYSIKVRNGEGREMSYNFEDEITLWVKNNSSSRDIFLTAPYSLCNVTLGGAMLYCGWPYYAWSAGYDTYYRSEQAKLMYSANTPDDLIKVYYSR